MSSSQVFLRNLWSIIHCHAIVEHERFLTLVAYHGSIVTFVRVTYCDLDRCIKLLSSLNFVWLRFQLRRLTVFVLRLPQKWRWNRLPGTIWLILISVKKRLNGGSLEHERVFAHQFRVIPLKVIIL